MRSSLRSLKSRNDVGDVAGGSAWDAVLGPLFVHLILWPALVVWTAFLLRRRRSRGWPCSWRFGIALAPACLFADAAALLAAIKWPSHDSTSFVLAAPVARGAVQPHLLLRAANPRRRRRRGRGSTRTSPIRPGGPTSSATCATTCAAARSHRPSRRASPPARGSRGRRRSACRRLRVRPGPGICGVLWAEERMKRDQDPEARRARRSRRSRRRSRSPALPGSRASRGSASSRA